MSSPMRSRMCVAVSSVALSLVAAGCSEPSTDPVPASERPSATQDPQSSVTEEPTTTEEPTASESGSTSEAGSSGDTGKAVPVYFVTDSGRGPRLVREFHRVTGDPLTEAARLVMGGGEPDDPDYRTLWPLVEIESAYATDGLLLVQLAGDGFTERPDGMTRREARLAIQQLVHTLQGVQQARARVLVKPMSKSARLFGLRTDVAFRNASALKVLNHVNITAPEEGSSHSGDSLPVSGVANSFEANVVCQVEVGETVHAQQGLTAQGWMGDRLFPFEGTLDTAGVPRGEALLRCSTDDASGGAEGPGPMTDTKTITLD